MKKQLSKNFILFMLFSILIAIPLIAGAEEADENDAQDAIIMKGNSEGTVTEYVYDDNTVTGAAYGFKALEAPTVSVSYAGSINWAGRNPIVGDKSFYIEILGTGLLSYGDALEAEVFILDDTGYTKVASQTEWRYLGKTAYGEERFIFQMVMDGNEELQESTFYYIDIRDSEDNYLFPDRNNWRFMVWSSGSAYLEGLNVSIISSTIDTLNISFNAYDFAPGQSKNDVDVELWQFAEMGWGPDGYGPVDEGNYIGTMGKENMVVDEIESNGYRIGGSIPISTTLTGGAKLYLKTTAKLPDGQEASVYSSFNPIKVLNGNIPTAESPKIINALGGGDQIEHGHGGGEPGDPVYIIDNSKDILEFELLATLTTNPGKISAQLLDGETVIGSLRAGSVTVQPGAHGIYTVKGIVDITGTVPDGALSEEGASLVISYNNTRLSSAIIKRSMAVGIDEIWCESSYYHFDQVYQLPLSGKIRLWLEGALNIQTSKISANLIDDSNNKVSLSVSAQRLDNGVTLTLTPQTAVEGKYKLELLYDDAPFMQIYYDPFNKNVVETGYPIADGVNALVFEFIDETVLKNIINDQGDLLVSGIAFDESASYRARLIKRVGTALNAQPFSVPASFISETELKINKEDLESFPQGWYTVYLTADDEQVKGFADVSLLSGSSIVLPKGTINNNAPYTTEADVILNLSAGSYHKVKFAETEEGLEQAEWQDITAEIPFHLSEGFGTKTIYFCFKTDTGDVYSLNDSIIYRNVALENMLDYGIANSKVLEDNTVYLNKDRNYTLYIISSQLNLTGKVEFYDESNTLIHTEELKRTASGSGIHTYAKTVKMDGRVENAVKIDFYLEDNEGFVSLKESKAAMVRNEAYISKTNTVFKTKNYHLLYVENGSEVQYTLSGTPNFQALAKLTYVDTVEETKTADYILAFDGNNGYSHKAALPGGVKKIVHVEYSLTDPNQGENKATKTEERNLEVTGTINFVGLDNASGDYNGKTITLFNYVDWYNQSQVIDDEKTSFSFTGLRPSGNYLYRVVDTTHTYATGSIDLASGQNKVENLSAAKVPAKIQFNVIGGTEPAQIVFREKDTYYDRYAESGKELEGFFVGQELAYRVILSEHDGKTFQIPEEKDIVITEKLLTIDITLEELAKIKVTGTITDERISGRNIDECVISVYQCFSNGNRFIDYNNTAVTDGEGKYEIEIYQGVPASMYISKTGYINKTLNFSSETDIVKNEGLVYNEQNKINIGLFARPLVNQGEALDNTTLTGLDNTNIRRVTVKKSDGVTNVDAYYLWHSSTIQIYDKNVKAGEKVLIYFEFADKMLSEKPFYEVTLDEYLNGQVDVVVVPNGEVTANVITGGDNPPASYMLLYDESGQQAAVITGIESLSSEFHNLKEGQYTAIIFKGYGLTRVQNIKMLEAFEFLDLEENTHYVKKSLRIENGKRTLLGDIELPELVSDDNLGFTETSVKTKFTPNNDTGEVLVVASFKPDLMENEEEITLESVSIYSSASLKGSEVYYDGEKYFNNSFIPQDKKNIDGMLYFTLIPSDMYQTTLTITLIYKIGNDYRYESFGVDNIDVPKITIIPPKEVLLGDSAKKILVRGIGLPESTIEIYDNDILIGETKIPAEKINYQATVALTYPDYAAGHMMYAKMITPDGETHMSSLKICEVIDPKKAAYTSHFEFNNGAGRSFINSSPDQSNQSLTLVYNPYLKTKVSFRINNLLKAQISYAALVSSHQGVDTMFEATHKRDVDEGGIKYSEWELEDYLGYLGDLSVYYALAYNEPLAPISGTKDIDFAEAIKQSNVDPADLPGAIRDNLDKREITQDDNNLEIVFPVADGSSLRVTGSFSEGHTISEDELKNQGYRKFETVQGYYWAKETLTQSGNSATYTKSMYFSPTLTTLLKSDTELRSMKIQSTGLMKSQGTANDVLSKADYAGYVYNIGEIVNDTSANPANLGKVGTGMQVVGGAVLVGQVLMGPTSKDDNALYAEAAKIEDVLVRSRLGDEIREYARARRSNHTVNTIFGGVSYGSGFAGPIGKGLSYIVSTGGMIYGQKTGTELDIWWDAVMRDIQNELILQEKRKQHKEKPKPGKRDEQKQPKWKIDPSGYVFEAIDSQRVAGVTASVLLKNQLDNEFYFWNAAEEWEEINPDITDQEGKYGWDVPAGEWKVSFSGTGYQNSETKNMTVPPVHDQVNIGLLSTKAPQVMGVALDTTGLEVEFDMFMQGETIYDPDRLTENLIVTDSGNNQVPCKRIDFIIESDNDNYKSGGLYQTGVIDADKFVKRIRFIPDTDLYPGGFKEYQDDGVTPETYQVTVPTNVQSYAGVNLEENYQSSALTIGTRDKAASPQADIPSGVYSTAQQVSIATQTAGAAIYYSTDGTTPTTLSRIYQEPIIITKTSIIKLLASKVGMDDSDMVTLNYTISPEVGNVVAAPTANIPGGTYYNKQLVTLTTSTAGATIYYTLDGSIPSKSSAVYMNPISIETTKTLKAVAVKEGYVNSRIAVFSYIIAADGPPGKGPGGNNDDNKEKLIEGEEVVPEILVNPFSDISKYPWAETAILNLTEQGIIKGISGTTFAPHANIKRADYIALMVRLFGISADVQENFSDVLPDKYYYHEVGIAKELKLIDGMGNNQFNPEASITRQDMFVIADRILRAQGLLTEEADVKILEKFSDYKLISPYAKQSMANLVSNGYILGNGNMLNPLNNTTRAETAVFIYRISQMLAKQ